MIPSAFFSWCLMSKPHTTKVLHGHRADAVGLIGDSCTAE